MPRSKWKECSKPPKTRLLAGNYSAISMEYRLVSDYVLVYIPTDSITGVVRLGYHIIEVQAYEEDSCSWELQGCQKPCEPTHWRKMPRDPHGCLSNYIGE